MDDATLQHRLRELSDRSAIRDVLVRYAQGLDRRDFELVAACFTEDAVADYGDGTPRAEGRERIVELVRVVERFASTTHLIGDQEIELDGDTALVETCAVDHLQYEREGTAYESWGSLRYKDHFVRDGNRWRITGRVMQTVWRRHEPGGAPDRGPFGGLERR